MILKIDDIKNNNQPTTNQALKDEISKMSSWEIKKQRYINLSQSKILSISLVGNIESLITIKEILDKSEHTRISEILKTDQIEKDINAIELMMKEDKNISLQSIVNSNIEKKLIDNDLSTNVLQKIPNSIEQLPEYIKDPIQFQIENVETKSIETSITNLKFDLNSKAYFKEFNIYGHKASIDLQNWGMQIKMNRQIMDMALNGSAGALWSALWTPAIGGCIYIALAVYYPCVWAVRSVLSAVVWGIRNWVAQNKWWCNSGLGVNLSYNSKFNIWCL